MYKPLSQTPNAPWPSAGATGNATTIKLCQSALPAARLACAQGGVVARRDLSRPSFMQYTEKSRGGAPAPYRVPHDARRSGPPPPPPAWPARNLLLETQRRRREKNTSLGRLVKRVSRSKLHCAGAAGRPKALFRDVSYALILFLSTHGRELLAQTAKTKVPSWNRQNYFIAPHSTRARLTRGGELGRNSVLKLHGGRPRQKKQP